MRSALRLGGIVGAALLPFASFAQMPAAAEAGHEIAAKFCSRCHAIGLDGASSHPSAPPFREIVAKGHVENLEEALGEGIVVGHPDMPQFQFSPHDVGALISYLKSLSGKG
jgi:mono/diheme cytochrome c family protein